MLMLFLHAVGMGASNQDAAVATTPKGGRVRKKGKRYVVEVDGQFFDAANAPQVQEILDQAVALTESAQILSKPKITIKTVRGRAVRAAAVTEALRRAQGEVNRIIDRNRALARARAQDEEDALAVLLM